MGNFKTLKDERGSADQKLIEAKKKYRELEKKYVELRTGNTSEANLAEAVPLLKLHYSGEREAMTIETQDQIEVREKDKLNEEIDIETKTMKLNRANFDRLKTVL